MRVKRAKCNPEAMPSNVEQSGNFLIHDFAKGDIVYNQYSPEHPCLNYYVEYY